MKNQYQTIIVNLPRPKETIYTYLKNLGHSENYLKNLRKQLGYIYLNGESVFINKRVFHNDELKIHTNPNTKTSIMHCIIPLDIVFEDDYLLVINKPSNLATMPTKSHFSKNLSGAIAYYMKDKDENFVVRIVNRLDKETAGLIVVAKNSLICNTLNRSNYISKKYYALCNGRANKDTYIISKNITTTLNSYGFNNNKRTTTLNSGKSAKTIVNVEKQYHDYFLASMTLENGRTHQIRVHMESIGHSLIGDKLYGQESSLISHTALVCKEINFVHPITNTSLHFCIDFPDDFKQLME